MIPQVPPDFIESFGEPEFVRAEQNEGSLRRQLRPMKASSAACFRDQASRRVSDFIHTRIRPSAFRMIALVILPSVAKQLLRMKTARRIPEQR
jgi:hypothetical protein